MAKSKVRLIKDLTGIKYLIGLDLALAKSGWSVLDLEKNKIVDYGHFKTKSSDVSGLRLRSIYREVKGICKRFPDYHLIKESLPMQSGKFTTIKTLQGLAMSHGVVQLYYPQADNIYPISIKSVARKYLGIGSKEKISKEQVGDAMNEIYNLDIKDTDVTDSIGVIYAFKIKFNKEIDEDIKEIRKKIKKLSTQKAVDKNIKIIEELESRKM